MASSPIWYVLPLLVLPCVIVIVVCVLVGQCGMQQRLWGRHAAAKHPVRVFARVCGSCDGSCCRLRSQQRAPAGLVQSGQRRNRRSVQRSASLCNAGRWEHVRRAAAVVQRRGRLCLLCITRASRHRVACMQCAFESVSPLSILPVIQLITLA